MRDSTFAAGAAAAGSLEAAGASSSIEWFYEERGKERGPVGAEVMADLIRNGTLRHATRVWRRGLSGWIPLMESELGRHLDGPPPLTTTAPKSIWTWLLATSPIVVVFLQSFAAGLRAGATGQMQRIYYGDVTIIYQMWPVGIGYITVLALADWLSLGSGRTSAPGPCGSRSRPSICGRAPRSSTSARRPSWPGASPSSPVSS